MKKKQVSKKGTLRNLLSALSIKNLLMLLLAGTINAFGVVLFLFPVKLYDMRTKRNNQMYYELCWTIVMQNCQ